MLRPAAMHGVHKDADFDERLQNAISCAAQYESRARRAMYPPRVRLYTVAMARLT